jgi:tryptophanyl-tRNA synthetase
MDWLSAGLDPELCTPFIQSEIKEHAELYLLLAMLTPLPWLERNPTYKEQQQQLDQKDLATYGFLGYPVLMAADIIIYRANGVPVGKDQLPHVELTREIARRFNFMYNTEVFPIPDPLLTEVPVLPGTDGRKMSKSYGNCIFITEPEESIIDKISKMMTDPQRIRRNDPGNPEVSPVFAYHKLYSSPSEVADIADGCRTARIGCVECKKRLMKNVIAKLAPIRERRLQLEAKAGKVREIIEAGNEKARREARVTMELVRRAVGLADNGH